MTPHPTRPPAANRVHEPTTAPRIHRSPQPLYGSSPEDAFAWHAAKYVAEHATVSRNAEIEVPTWPGRSVTMVDYLVEVGGRRIAVELHGPRRLIDHIRLRRRDARLVASGAVDAVYRIGGSGVADRVEDALFLIAAWERAAGAGRYVPDAFSSRGRANLSRLSSREARTVELRADRAAALVVYPSSAAARRRGRRRRERTPHLLLRRFDRRFPQAWQHEAAPAPRNVPGFLHSNAA